MEMKETLCTVCQATENVIYQAYFSRNNVSIMFYNNPVISTVTFQDFTQVEVNNTSLT